MRTKPVTVTLDLEDALLAGLTLASLARSNPTPDQTANERLRRVGDQISAAARSAR